MPAYVFLILFVIVAALNVVGARKNRSILSAVTKPMLLLLLALYVLFRGLPAPDWLIIGAETGNRKGKVVPDKDWIMEIAEECELMDIPLFMKESLRGIMGKDFRQEFPWK